MDIFKQLLCIVTIPFWLLQPVLSLSPDGKCRVLALKGGGVHGAYEAGVIKALTDELSSADVHWDVVSGVSIGSFVASVLSSHDFGQEQQAADKLVEIFSNTTPEDFFDWWPTYILETFQEPSAVDSQKLADYFAKNPDLYDWKRKIVIPSVDLDSGRVVFYDETAPKEIRQHAILGSMSVPVVFKPIDTQIRGQKFTLIDGGTYANV